MKTALIATALIAMLAPAAAYASDDCPNVPRDQWMSEAAIIEKAAGMGYEVRTVEADDGCYEVKATDQAGRLFEIEFHPGTGDVIELEAEDDDKDDKDEKDND
jgi:hypothetical protein